MKNTMSRNQLVRWVYEESKPYNIDFSYKDARQFCKSVHWVDDWEIDNLLGLEFAKRRMKKYFKIVKESQNE